MKKYLDILGKAWNQKIHSKKEGNLTPVFIGKPGTGKTSLPKQFCRENNLELFIINLAVADPTDLTGIPYNKDGIMYYSKPFFLNMKRGILFFDEINRVTSSEMKAGLLSLMVDGKINGHELSKEVIIVGAGNDVDNKNETVEFDEAFTDRIVVHDFDISWAEWIEYIDLTHEDSELKNFYLFIKKEDAKKFSYRRLEYVLNHFEVNRDIGYIATALSPGFASAFQRFTENKNYTLEDMLKGRQFPKDIEPAVERQLLRDFFSFVTTKGNVFPEGAVKIWYSFLGEVRAENLSIFINKLIHNSLNDAEKHDILLEVCIPHKLLSPIKEEMEQAKYNEKDAELANF